MRAFESSLSKLHLVFSRRFQRMLVKNNTDLSAHIDKRVVSLLMDSEASNVQIEANLRMAVTVEEAYRHFGDLEALQQDMHAASSLLLKACKSTPASLSLLELQLNACSKCFLGDAFSCAIEREEHALTFVVDKCFFNSYFVSVGKPFLTVLFCNLDNEFGVNLPRESFRYTREQTLATGSKKCVFKIERAVSDGKQEPVIAAMQ